MTKHLSDHDRAQLGAALEANDREGMMEWANGQSKARIKGFLEKMVADRLEAVAGLKELLAQIDQASPWLLTRFVVEGITGESEALEARFDVGDRFHYPCLDCFLFQEITAAAERFSAKLVDGQ